MTGFSTVFAYIGFGFFMFAAFVSFSIDAASANTMYATVRGLNLEIFYQDLPENLFFVSSSSSGFLPGFN